MLDIAFARPALPKSGALVLLVSEGEMPSGLWQQADEATDGAIARALAAAEFKGAKGKTCTILAPGAGLSRVIVVGLGKPSAFCAAGVRGGRRRGGGAVGARAGGGDRRAMRSHPDQAAQVAFGAVLRAYRFDRYRTKEKPEDKPKLAKLTLLVADPARGKAAWEPLAGVANGVFLTRDLVSEPANVLNPAEMANRCKKLTELGVKVEVLGPREMTKLGFGALLGVAQGSVNEPRMVVMQWNGASGRGRRTRQAAGVHRQGRDVRHRRASRSSRPAAWRT